MDHSVSASRPFWLHSPAFVLRGGESTTSDAPAAEETSLDDKVQAAMKKLGIASSEEDGDGDQCKDGVCPMPKQAGAQNINPNDLADEISQDMNVDASLAMAAIGATSTIGDNNQRIYNEKGAREMIQYELDIIANIPPDSAEVKQLVEEGFDSFLSRRALAFAESNMDDARAILVADQMDEEEEREAAKKAEGEKDEEAAIRAQLRNEQAAKKPDIVEVKADFDPTTLPHTPVAARQQTQAPPQGMPKPAAKETVVFEATTAQIQSLVLESPVPVLLDVYADWCGPCKVLGPALEEMAVKSGGAFRLVKVNSDNEKPVSAALEVTALPTVYGVRDGKIVHLFQGMPKSEEMMKNFMMGLFGAAPFQPAVTAEQSAKYAELTGKLIKTAGAASFSFSARERLTDRIGARLDELVQSDSVGDVEGAARLMRTLFNNLVRHPMDAKFRTINMANKVIASKLGDSPICVSILKSVGFSKSGSEMVIGKGKKIINVAPLMVARDTIDNWIQKNQREMAAATRRQKDEIDRAKLQAEREAAGPEESDDEEEAEEVDPTVCNLKLRLDGKNRVHDVSFHENDTLSKVLDALDIASEEEVQITCVAKRLVVKSSDSEAMKKTLSDHGLMPAAAIVVKVGGGSTSAEVSSLKERATKKSRKKGSHTMQSVGIYSKDDNNKAELIDGGGGVLYEHDISDDEEEAEIAESSNNDVTDDQLSPEADAKDDDPMED